MICEATIRVRYAETDTMGVVYYGHYLTYFEVGRVELSLFFDVARDCRTVPCFHGACQGRSDPVSFGAS